MLSERNMFTPISMLPKRTLLNGRSVSVTTIGLGGGFLGNAGVKVSDEDAYATVKAMWDRGGRYFDTAPLYGVGMSLDRLGKALCTYPREEYVISSKVGLVIKSGGIRSKVDAPFLDGRDEHMEFDYSYAGIMCSIEQNLKHLNTNYLDIALVHDLGRFVHGDQHEQILEIFFDKDKGGLRALLELRENGKIRAFGLGVNEYEVCVEVIRKGFIPDCIMLAGRYTLLDQCALGEFFDLCAEHRVSVIVAGVYNSGILSGDPNNRSYNYKLAKSEIFKRKEAIEVICNKHEVALPQAALHFPLLHPQVVSVVTGAYAPEEIKKSIAHLLNPVNPELWTELKDAKLIAQTAPIKSVRATKQLMC